MTDGAPSSICVRMDPPPDEEALLRFQRPVLPDGDAIERYLRLARDERWFSNGGPCWRLLRERLSERAGAYCVPVASGTAGLMAAVAALLVDPRQDDGRRLAAMPSFTFAATAQATTWAELEPHLLDLDPDSWQLDGDQLERELSRHRGDAALVVAVSAFGTPPPAALRRRWEEASATAGVPLVVDSAAAFGTIGDDGVAVGAQGDVEVVSFHATKPFAIGEGGAVFTRSVRLCERIERAVNFGLDTNHAVVLPRSLNGKMSELHAATALAVLDDYDDILVRRRAAAAQLRVVAGDEVAWQQDCERSTWQFAPVAFPDAPRRSAAVDRCAGEIETRTYYEPLHRMPAFRGRSRAADGLARTEELAARLLCMPMANDLTDGEVARIGAAIRGPVTAPAQAARPSG
jgi:dTDP-4-amino-4,6-dideoxygalactose transaminase